MDVFQTENYSGMMVR